MVQNKYSRISFDQIAEHADQYVIKNFMLSANMNMPAHYPLNEAFVVDGIVFSICIKGYAKLKVNFKEFELIQNSLSVLLPNQIAKYIERSDDFILETLFVSWDFLTDLPFPRDIGLLLNLEEYPCMNVSGEIMLELIEYHTMIVKQYNQVRQPYRLEIVKGLLYVMIMELFGIYITNKEIKRKTSNRQEELVRQLLKLLLEHFREERSVSFYADKLCITSKHLSSIVKNITGRSILSWIHEIIIMESKSLLRTSTMTALQISEYLNFPTPSFFGRFFKGHVGMTPLEYREQ